MAKEEWIVSIISIMSVWSNFVLKLKIQFVFKSEENKIRLILNKSWFSYNIGAGKALDL